MLRSLHRVESCRSRVSWEPEPMGVECRESQSRDKRRETQTTEPRRVGSQEPLELKLKLRGEARRLTLESKSRAAESREPPEPREWDTSLEQGISAESGRGVGAKRAETRGSRESYQSWECRDASQEQGITAWSGGDESVARNRVLGHLGLSWVALEFM